MAYELRELAGSDVERLKGLLRVFGRAFDEQATYEGTIPSDSYLQALLARPHFIAVVALAGDDVVAGLTAYVLDKFERERSEVYIYDLAVAEEHRRRGLATGLIRALKPIARSRGAYVIFVQADQGDAPAIRLYESLGTREDVHHFDIAVDD
jgi:ribosomal protein S18 acetylase RimI-like enzyme